MNFLLLSLFLCGMHHIKAPIENNIVSMNDMLSMRSNISPVSITVNNEKLCMDFYKHVESSARFLSLEVDIRTKILSAMTEWLTRCKITQLRNILLVSYALHDWLCDYKIQKKICVYISNKFKQFAFQYGYSNVY